MKNAFKWIICLLCLIAADQPLLAKERNTVAVLPFSVVSADNIDYIRQGVGNMLSSRLSINEKIDVISRDLVQTALTETGGKELTLADINSLGKKLNADYVVWGSITKIGSSLSIDGKLFDVAAYKPALSTVVQCQSMDEVIPKITDFAQRIETHISGAPASALTSSPTAKEVIVSRRPMPEPTRDAEIISGMKSSKKGTFTSSVNPDFINAEQPLNKQTFWKSQQFLYELRGMDIGDVNGDGLNETVMMSTNNIYIYQKKGNDFNLIQHLPGKSYDNYISIDVADINQNGIKEIIVTNYLNKTVDSFVIEFKSGKFTTIASGLPWFMRVIDNASGAPFLIGQRRGFDLAFETPIHEIVWKDGGYREGKKMKIPEGISIYGLTIDKLTGGGSDKIISLNQDDYLCIYEETNKPLSKVVIFGGSNELIWKSQEPFGGSNIYIDPLDRTTSVDVERDRSYINLRILTYDTNKDGKREIIIVRNISASGRTFQYAKLFNAAEIYNLEWDGLGMVENWRTRQITGYVSDYQFKDIDNDGENEVVLSLVLSTGISMGGRSVIISYDLKGP